MATKFVSERNIKFLLHEVFNIESLTGYPYFKQHNRKLFNMVLDAAVKIGQDLLRPILEEMDKIPPVLEDGEVKVHRDVKKIMKECGQGGWIAATFPEELDGEQLPISISNCCYFILAAANYSGYAYPLLTTGASNLIISFGSKDQIENYVPKMVEGEWQGTMALTEPQAGSSLADIATTAEPTEKGYYKIKGQKIFISAGDHDGVENVVHMMLARIEGTPEGVKGISLFIVPKNRINEIGKLENNDITVSQIYHKLGYRGTPITELIMGEKDDCRGYLVGEPNRGLFYMFQMMNEARIGVGLGAAAVASAAYYASLDYAQNRPQGRKISEKDPSKPQIPIIEHADVKRMLLFQRAVVEGSLSLILQCSLYADLGKLTSGEEKEKYELLLDILTPIAKSYPSEMGIQSVSQGLQCLGGYGYCDDFPLEQYYRDIRINPIHEGTTGIQGIDLLGRKVMMKNGKAFLLYLEEIKKTIRAAEAICELKPYSRQLFEAMEVLVEVTDWLKGVAITKRPEVFLADATLYLELFSITAIAWQWLLQTIYAQRALEGELSQKETNFYQGKRFVFLYFFAYELPKIEGLARRLKDSNPLTVDMKKEYFSD